uniref:CSON006643 protein n=1 Tax=Culicoides sonorensis TaxID=179676 RepID=A0A336MWV8_CULSO
MAHNNLELILIAVISSLFYQINFVHGINARYVTCGSVIKLLNVDYRVRLHSHDVKYGSGSGQQSVTGTELQEDVGSHWTIKGKTGKFCERGEPIKCGEIIRLHHTTTNKNLHSHLFRSPLSGNQEISCYGDENGEGDTGDHWEVICSSEWWERDSSIKFKHVDTQKWLGVSGRSFGRPISGQQEIVGFNGIVSGVDWKAAEGVFIHQTELPQYISHEEL